MNTAVVITKTEPEVKKKAQALAREFGVSLSSLINAFLKQMVRTRRVELTAHEEPSEYLIKSIKRAEKNIREGNVSPKFRTGKEAVDWLEKQGI